MEERLLSLLRLAIKYAATDIHFYVRYQETKIQMRIDGVQRVVKTKFDDYKLIRYLQYLANLDVGNMSMPQTGNFELEVDNKLLQLRFAIINSLDNTQAVLRILNTTANYVVDSEKLKSAITKNCGLVIISGPTGSGKTTTAYSLLKTLNNKKIYSFEDPIECYIDSIVQIEANDAVGLDAESGIKQILRHNPDVIFVGEIRDAAAARMAITAANTGHLVLTTMHAGSCESTYTRMLEFGVNKDSLDETLLLISNLRLNIKEDGSKEVVYTTKEYR